MKKELLMIAAEYPPCLSAGVQRTFHFSKDLLDSGWMPLVLSANPLIYDKLDKMVSIPSEIEQKMERAFALNAMVHLSIKGKYPGFFGDPDRFAVWFYFACLKGLKLIRHHKPELIWSTFPVSTAHRTGLYLKKKSGLPWVADFRDPLHSHVDPNYQLPRKAKVIDAKVARSADALVFATDKMSQLYQAVYPEIDKRKFYVIENGYNGDVFDNLDAEAKTNSDKFVLLYSGAIYQQGRDPVPVFKALNALRNKKKISPRNFIFRFRGSGNGEDYQEIIESLNISDIVEFCSATSHEQSIKEMKSADALLVLQGAIFDNQIPGKVYEYIAARKPVLALVGCHGATKQLLGDVASSKVVPENDAELVERALDEILDGQVGEVGDVSQYSRSARSKQLVSLFDDVLAS